MAITNAELVRLYALRAKLHEQLTAAINAGASTATIDGITVQRFTPAHLRTQLEDTEFRIRKLFLELNGGSVLELNA